MEENIVRVDENEEIDNEEETEEASGGATAGAFVAGLVGGIMAYAVASGAKKLVAMASTKLRGRKKKKPDVIVDAEIIESEPKQTDSAEEDSGN